MTHLRELRPPVHHQPAPAFAGGSGGGVAGADPGRGRGASWIPALQKDTRTRNVHASTAIEGNPLTLEQVRALEEGRELAASGPRSQREVLNYFAGLRYVEKHAGKKTISHEDVLKLHRILAAGVMDQGEAGRYRTIAVRVGRYVPPAPGDVSGLMFELLEWWNKGRRTLAGAQFGHPALSLRGHPSVCRRQRPHRPRAGAVGAVPARIRHASHFLGGRILLGGSSALLRRAGGGAARGRRPDRLAGVLRRGAAADAGARVAARPGIPPQIAGEAGSATQAGTVAAAPPRSRQHVPGGDLGRAGRFQARRDGFAAPAARGRIGGKDRQQEDRALRPAPQVNETRADNSARPQRPTRLIVALRLS